MSGLKKFRRDCKGGVAIIFAFAALPLLTAVGMGLDFARAAQRRQELQVQVDTALLSLSRKSIVLTDTQLKAEIRSYILQGGYPASELGEIVITRSGRTLSVAANAAVPTTLMKLAQINTVDIAAKATARWMQAEVVLVLDTSGSMAGTRLSLLKAAVTDFIDKSAGSDGAMKYGMVPFAQGVRVPTTSTYKNAEWIDFSGNINDGMDGEDGEDGIYGEAINLSSWQGCLVDRKIPYNIDDTFFDNLREKKYPAVQTCSNEQNLNGRVQDLGTLPADLKAAVNSMGAGGATNMTIGVAWGHAMLTKQVPFTQTVEDPNTPEVETRRILILMTDGQNTASQHSYTKSDNDAWTKYACTSAKTAGIEIYAVGFIGGDADVLGHCASSSAHHLTAGVDDLGRVFGTLAQAVRKPNLTH
jgi:Flp pilus assembly protein TadG